MTDEVTTPEIIEHPSLWAAMVAVHAELRNPGKDQHNPGARSKFAALPDILDEVRPILARHGLSVSQHPGQLHLFDQPVEVKTFGTDSRGNPTERRMLLLGKQEILTVVWHTTGERSWTHEQLVEREHGGNLSWAQGGAITYGRRYALEAALGIAEAGCDDDGGGSIAPPQQQQASGWGAGPPSDEAYREAYSREPDCPQCGQQGRRSKLDDATHTHYCWKKKGGCGHQWTPQEEASQDGDDALSDTQQRMLAAFAQERVTREEIEEAFAVSVPQMGGSIIDILGKVIVEVRQGRDFADAVWAHSDGAYGAEAGAATGMEMPF